MKLVVLKTTGDLDRGHFGLISASISSIREQASDLMSILDRDKPFTYLHRSVRRAGVDQCNGHVDLARHRLVHLALRNG
jgi:hypothetical protein